MIIKSLSERVIPLHLNYTAYIVQINTPEFINHYKKKNIYWYSYECYNCEDRDNLIMHHLVPVCECGKHSYSNLLLLCSKCHHKVEWGLIELNIKGKINYRLIRKTNKILRKYYKEYGETLIGTYPKEFVKRHLELNYTVKYLLKHNMNENARVILIENRNPIIEDKNQ